MLDITQIDQSVAARELQRSCDYGGHRDLVLLTDFGQMGAPVTSTAERMSASPRLLKFDLRSPDVPPSRVPITS